MRFSDVFTTLLKINVVIHLKECNFAPHRGMEQLVARRAHNPKVIGSSPVPATKLKGSHFESLFYFFSLNLMY